MSAAVSLLGLATAVVLAALATQAALWIGGAALLAVALSWVALRMMWIEILQARRENAADRSAAAMAYRTIWDARAAEHAAFTTEMTGRLAEATLACRELEGRVAQQQSATETAQGRVRELEALLVVREAEAADALATWEADAANARPRRPRLVKEA